MLLIASTQVVDFVAVDNVHVMVILIAIYYWTINVPAMMPYWFVFLSGLVVDISVDSLLGLHAFTFLVYVLILERVARIIKSQPLMYHIVIFILSAALFEIVRWGMISLISLNLMPVFPSVLSVVLNCVAFLPVMLVLKGLSRIVFGHGSKL
jgi:rod shape-determining protein MreD